MRYRYYVDPCDRDCFFGENPSGVMGLWITKPGFRLEWNTEKNCFDAIPMRKGILYRIWRQING